MCSVDVMCQWSSGKSPSSHHCVLSSWYFSCIPPMLHSHSAISHQCCIVELIGKEATGSPMTCQAGIEGRKMYGCIWPYARRCWVVRRYSWERDPIPIVQEAGWALGLFQMGLKNCATYRIRTPDLPAYRKFYLYIKTFLHNTVC